MGKNYCINSVPIPIVTNSSSALGPKKGPSPKDTEVHTIKGGNIKSIPMFCTNLIA